MNRFFFIRPLKRIRTSLNYINFPFRSSKSLIHTPSTTLQPNVFFFGSDLFSSIILKKLFNSKHLWNQLYLVVPPISRTGRGLKKVYRPPLMEVAHELNLPCHTLTKLDPPNQQDNPLKNWPFPDEFNFKGNETKGDQKDPILITASFPYKIPSRIIELFKRSRTLNVHPSLLPKYRGPAPIQWQIADQQSIFGVTIQDLSTIGFDRGLILAQNQITLPDSIDYAQAEVELARLASVTLCDVVSDLDHFIANAKPQDESKATHSPKITQLDLRIYSSMTVDQVEARYRAMSHHYPLSIKVNSDVFFVIPDFSKGEEVDKETDFKAKKEKLKMWKQVLRGKGEDFRLGELSFNRELNLIGIRLTKCKDQAEYHNETKEEVKEEDILVIKKLKLAAPGGKGWIHPDQWWDRLINQSQNSSSSPTNSNTTESSSKNDSSTTSTPLIKKNRFFLDHQRP